LLLVWPAIDRAEMPAVSGHGNSGDRPASEPVIYLPVQDYGSEEAFDDSHAARADWDP
jgi:hypothetical protein